MRFKPGQLVRTAAFGMKECIGDIRYVCDGYYKVHIDAYHEGQLYYGTIVRFDEEIIPYEYD